MDSLCSGLNLVISCLTVILNMWAWENGNIHPEDERQLKAWGKMEFGRASVGIGGTAAVPRRQPYCAQRWIKAKQATNASAGYLALKYLNQRKSVSVTACGCMGARGESRDLNVLTRRVPLSCAAAGSGMQASTDASTLDTFFCQTQPIFPARYVCL